MIDRSDCWQRQLVAGELTSVPRPDDDDNDVDDVIPELPVTNAAIVLLIQTSLGLALCPG